ncbi:MAG: meso-butanediol dehydrogenase/(S,S)-butanediol dehydrogenase/diacetyl reductase [Gammaproteobacteria bacterium]|jgi:meso-butanediol dehydrogenase/(S,S)-butanediol dehydrogenase/diacetyl reductase
MPEAILSFSFRGSKVLVTGGTSGMGEAAALGFAKAGAEVVISGRDQARGDSVCNRSTGEGSISFMAGDISDRETCDELVASAANQLGGLDIVVNSAGVIFHGTAEETTDQQWLQTMNVNVNGMFYVCRAAIPHLRKSRGTIINIASDASLSGSCHLVAYCASKGAVLQMTRAMALDYAAEGIRIVPICPGDVDTPMLRGEFRDRGLTLEAGLKESAEGVPLKRVCSAEEVADMVLYACTDSAKFITGYPLVLDGGNRA